MTHGVRIQGFVIAAALAFRRGKANLAPLRLVSFFALAIASAHAVSRDSNFLSRCLAQSIIRCGQHSLQIFCLGILLSVSGHIMLTSIRADVPMQLAIDLVGILLMIAIAQLLTWSKASGGRQSGAPLAAWTTFLAGGESRGKQAPRDPPILLLDAPSPKDGALEDAAPRESSSMKTVQHLIH